jgi:hypothetical protein
MMSEYWYIVIIVLLLVLTSVLLAYIVYFDVIRFRLCKC